ncbi:MAG: POTRA domain-containing protein [Methylococcales bacterium]|nr:POTRA domain-containing protein [Methylococcales bacterium]
MNKICRFVITLLLGYLPAIINAVPVLPDSGLIMRESSKMPAMPKKPADAGVELLPLKKPMAVQDNLRVSVKSFSFSGNSHFPTSTLQSQLGGYTNRELGFAELQQAANVITGYYRKAGFPSAYAYIPEQTLEHGQVELAIFEGKMDDEHIKK